MLLRMALFFLNYPVRISQKSCRATLTTKLGTRTYEVASVEKVNENDTSGLNPTSNDQITLYTCVRDQRDNRWKVVAVAK